MGAQSGGRGANGYSANANDDDSSFQWCSVVCVGSVFFSNTAQCGGGALDMGVSSLTIQDCLLVWNAAIAQASPVCESVGGGGVYFVGVSFTAARTTFAGCSAGINEPAAQACGGAVLAYSDATASSAFQLVNCTMCSNSVFTQYSSGTAGGGAAVAWFQRVVINSCDFADNFGNFGGVLFVYGGDSTPGPVIVEWINTTCEGNYASFSGGCLFVGQRVSLVVNGSHFIGNVADTDGAAITLTDCGTNVIVSLSQSFFILNLCGRWGCAIAARYQTAPRYVGIDLSQFSRNAVGRFNNPSAGSVIQVSSAAVTMTNCLVNNNQAVGGETVTPSVHSVKSICRALHWHA